MHVWKRRSHFESRECSTIHHVIRFKPTSGTIREIKFRSTPKVWGYFHVGSNGGIHEFADSQFGHMFSTGTDREDARKHLIIAVKVLLVPEGQELGAVALDLRSCCGWVRGKPETSTSLADVTIPPLVCSQLLPTFEGVTATLHTQ